MEHKQGNVPTGVGSDGGDRSNSTSVGEQNLKDSGARIAMGGGMVREPSGSRTNYLLAFDGPLFERYAVHMTRGARKYSPRNWMRIANATREERAEARERYRESAARHFMAWLAGDTAEDHAAALVFNLNVHEFLVAIEQAELEVERSRCSWCKEHRACWGNPAVLCIESSLPAIGPPNSTQHATDGDR